MKPFSVANGTPRSMVMSYLCEDSPKGIANIEDDTKCGSILKEIKAPEPIASTTHLLSMSYSEL